MAGPKLAVIKTKQVNISITICPANKLAKRRIIRAIGFVNRPNNSITGIIGIGAFNQVGTSGQKTSFQ